MAERDVQNIRVRRAYEAASPDDGQRVLVDRIWPRGVSKDALAIDAWLKDAAPSSALRKWFGHDPAKWDGFKERYFRELDDRPEVVGDLRSRCAGGPLTLVYSARDTRHNNAVALKAYLESRG